MAFTTSDLTAVEAAIATGELRVEIDGKTVMYRSITELQKARDMILAALSVTSDKPRVFYYTQAGRRD